MSLDYEPTCTATLPHNTMTLGNTRKEGMNSFDFVLKKVLLPFLSGFSIAILNPKCHCGHVDCKRRETPVAKGLYKKLGIRNQ